MSRIEQAWRSRGALALALWPVSMLYRWIMSLRRIAYRLGLAEVHASPLPVVVVGNLSVGGTGKTPLCSYLVEHFRQAGWCPGIVSRGYGGQRHLKAHLIQASDSPAHVGDEPFMLFRQTGVPVCVCVKRALAVEHLASHTDVDIVFSDDGLQHLAMQRMAEVVVVDGNRGFGNGWLLPAGPLREPVKRLAHADMIVMQTTDRQHQSSIADGKLTRDADVVEERASDSYSTDDLHPSTDGSNLAAAVALAAVREQTDSCEKTTFTLTLSNALSLNTGLEKPLEDFKGHQVIAMAGIGHPKRFFDALRAKGLEVLAESRPDHHAFTLDDFSMGPALPVLVTSKDAVKIRSLGTLPVDVYEVPVLTTPSDALYARIISLERQLRNNPVAKQP